MPTIGIDSNSGLGGVTFSTADKHGILSISSYRYTPSVAENVNEVGFWHEGSVSGSLEVGVYRHDTLALVCAAAVSGSGGAGRKTASVSGALSPGVAYVVGWRVVSNVSGYQVYNAGSTIQQSALTGSSALADPFVPDGTTSAQRRAVFATTEVVASAPVIDDVSDTTPAIGSALVIDTTNTSASGNTVELTDGTDTITLTVTAESDTEVTATVSNGGVFKYGVPLDLVVKDAADAASAPFELTELVPPAGHAAVNITSLHPDVSKRFSSAPELIPSCQLEHTLAEWLTVNGDGTWTTVPGATFPLTGQYRIHSPAEGGDPQNWSGWETFTISQVSGGGGGADGEVGEYVVSAGVVIGLGGQLAYRLRGGIDVVVR